jgi:hypothetical protein
MREGKRQRGSEGNKEKRDKKWDKNKKEHKHLHT